MVGLIVDSDSVDDVSITSLRRYLKAQYNDYSLRQSGLNIPHPFKLRGMNEVLRSIYSENLFDRDSHSVVRISKRHRPQQLDWRRPARGYVSRRHGVIAATCCLNRKRGLGDPTCTLIENWLSHWSFSFQRYRGNVTAGKFQSGKGCGARIA